MELQEIIGRSLHTRRFLEEFSFDRTQFTPETSSEVELADAVVMLGDVLFIFQMKERQASTTHTPESERRWFQAKVLKKAVSQVKDTLAHLSSGSDILVPNIHGDLFNLGARTFRAIHKVVVYHSHNTLPDDCTSIQFHQSSIAGFIHIIEGQDYWRVAHTLGVPEEIVRYFEYRQHAITRFGSYAEPVLVGQFLSGEEDVRPNAESLDYLSRLITDDDFDLTPLLRTLRDHYTTPGLAHDYYKILNEFAKFPRSIWRETKKRFVRAMEKVRDDSDTAPYRLAYLASDCGLVIVPVSSEFTRDSHWDTQRLDYLINMTVAHKYDQGLSKSIGVLLYEKRGMMAVEWCMADFPWKHEPELERLLKENFPFRKVKGQEVEGYRLALN